MFDNDLTSTLVNRFGDGIANEDVRKAMWSKYDRFVSNILNTRFIDDWSVWFVRFLCVCDSTGMFDSHPYAECYDYQRFLGGNLYKNIFSAKTCQDARHTCRGCKRSTVAWVHLFLFYFVCFLFVSFLNTACISLPSCSSMDVIGHYTLLTGHEIRQSILYQASG